MPTVEENKRVFNEDQNWSKHWWKGEAWSRSWGGSEPQWFGTIFPRIHAFIPTGTILEIAPGFGRWTQYLKDYCEHLIVVELAEHCIEVCRERFSSCSHITYHVNDGKSLTMIPDGSIDFVFSHDSLVAAEADVIKAYLDQLAKKLKPNGVGFIHHSNIKEYQYLFSALNKIPGKLRKPLISKGAAFLLDNFRAHSMTAGLFEEYCEEAGLQCISQELINWYGRLLSDCFSLFTPKSSVWARSNKIYRNKNHMREGVYISKLSKLYATSQLQRDAARGMQHPPERVSTATVP